MLAIALCVRLTSRGPAFFAQYRVGRGGRLFRVYKFRSMTWDAGHRGPGLTRSGDCRITAMGRWLRKLKLDELPQFYNVLRGEMSLVGPRPKLPRYTGIVNMPYRPGITGAATLAFRREEGLLSRIHPSLLDDYYSQHIRPLKTRMDVRYMCRATFWSDLRLIGVTFLACLTPSPTPLAVRHAPTQFIAYPPHTAPQVSSAKSFESAI
jgi:lipopolysaccharide/colanic/teichoic acid biosynthesis glycosyltransferase